jgi:glycylpeptide N-tetradecanoyltransferase
LTDGGGSQDPETHRITDMFSFYSLPSTAVKVKPLTHINAAYLFYYATTACPSCSDLGDGSVATPITNWKDETDAERAVLKERLGIVIGEALVLAAKVSSGVEVMRLELIDHLQHGFDVFNALTLQDNSIFLEDLKVSSHAIYLDV